MSYEEGCTLASKTQVSRVIAYIYFFIVLLVLLNINDDIAIENRRFLLGFVLVYFVLYAKDTVILIARYFLNGDRRIHNITGRFNKKTAKITCFTLLIFVLSLGCFGWVISWEGTTGLPFAFGTLFGSILYDFCIRTYVYSTPVP